MVLERRKLTHWPWRFSALIPARRPRCSPEMEPGSRRASDEMALGIAALGWQDSQHASHNGSGARGRCG